MIKKLIILLLENVFCIENIPLKLIKSNITYKEALEIAFLKVQEYGKESGFELKLVEQFTIRKEFGWIFFYTSKKYFETKIDEEKIAGNAPFIVDNRNGKIVGLGTGDETAYYVHLYRKYRNNLEKFNKKFFRMKYYPQCWLKKCFGRLFMPYVFKREERRWNEMK